MKPKTVTAKLAFSLATAFVLIAIGISFADTKKSDIQVEETPIHITAKRMEVRSENNTIVFKHNVVAVQGNITITSDKLEIFVAEGEERKIREMIAAGNVQYRQYFPEDDIERFATGQEARYSEEDGTLILTGEPRAWENNNIVTGQTMTFHTRENLFLVDGKVKVTFYPEKQRQQGSPQPENQYGDQGN